MIVNLKVGIIHETNGSPHMTKVDRHKWNGVGSNMKQARILSLFIRRLLGQNPLPYLVKGCRIVKKNGLKQLPMQRSLAFCRFISSSVFMSWKVKGRAEWPPSCSLSVEFHNERSFQRCLLIMTELGVPCYGFMAIHKQSATVVASYALSCII